MVDEVADLGAAVDDELARAVKRVKSGVGGASWPEVVIKWDRTASESAREEGCKAGASVPREADDGVDGGGVSGGEGFNNRKRTTDGRRTESGGMDPPTNSQIPLTNFFSLTGVHPTRTRYSSHGKNLCRSKTNVSTSTMALLPGLTPNCSNKKNHS